MSLGNLIDNNPNDINDLRNGTLSTTIVVNVDPSVGLVVEVDSREDGYNSGDTSFVALDEPAFLLYRTPYVDLSDLTILTSLASPYGIISEISRTEYVEQEEVIVFAQNGTQKVSKPMAGVIDNDGYFTARNFSYEVLGSGSQDFIVVPDYFDGVRLVARGIADPDEAVMVVRVTYLSEVTAYRLTNTPPDINGRTDYTIAIVISGSAKSVYDKSNAVGSRTISSTDRETVTSIINSTYLGDV